MHKLYSLFSVFHFQDSSSLQLARLNLPLSTGITFQKTSFNITSRNIALSKRGFNAILQFRRFTSLKISKIFQLLFLQH